MAIPTPARLPPQDKSTCVPCPHCVHCIQCRERCQQGVRVSDDLVGVHEIAAVAGVSRQAVTNWRTRHVGFPKPVADLRSGPVFDRQEVLGWLSANRSAERKSRDVERPQRAGGALSSDSVARLFTATVASIAGNERLRLPQADGHQTAADFFAAGSQTHAVEQIPVGCGKTGLITLLPFGIARGRVLVVAPNVTIRGQLADAFDVTNPDCFYRTAGVLADLSGGPFVAVLDVEANRSDLDEAHVAVTNIHQLANADRWLNRLPHDYFDMIIIDEGHHNAAPSWQQVFSHFPQARVISLTATPFRADEQPVLGDVIYRSPLAEAMRRGYVKTMRATNVAPRDIYFTYRGEDRHHTLDEVLRLKDKDWFSRGVALAEECNTSIVDASIAWLNHLRESGGVRHQIVASACSLAHARSIRRLYEERNLVARDYHSEQPEDERKRIMRDLREGVLDVIVQVQMLGEGFDHPPLSVAAIFRPYRSLSPYVQFVGRAMRVNVQNNPGHDDNGGIIVSHVGLNLDRHWQDFKEIDELDQQLVEDWLDAGEVPIPGPRRNGNRRRLRPEMVVTDEVTMDQFLSDTYLADSNNDEESVDAALEAMRANGFDPAALGLTRQALLAQRRAQRAREPVGPTPLPVQPQNRRRVRRRGLDEDVRSVANRILEALGQGRGRGRIAALGIAGATSNLQAVIVLMNQAVNRSLGRDSGERRELSSDELKQALTALDL